MEIISSSELRRFYEQRGVSKDKTVLRYFDEDGKEVDSLTFSQLDKEALSVAGHLRDAMGLIPGTPVALLFPPGLEMLRCLLGCIYAGLRAVPLAPPPPTQWKDRIPALQTLLAKSQATLGLTSSQLLPMLRWTDWNPDKDPVKIQWENLNISSLPSVSSLSVPEVTSQTVCVLQFSSGSTGNPKGVMLSHENLIHNSEKITRQFSFRKDSIGVSWLPMYHDMGLIGNFFAPLLWGGTNVLISPLAFLRRPLMWLELISQFKADVSGAPNFAYELVVKNLLAEPLPPSLDLSEWRVAYCGAEPVRVSTMKKFIEHFAAFGFKPENFYPVYGMAEATLLISCKNADQPSLARIRSVDKTLLATERKVREIPEGQQMISLGVPESDTEVIVVNVDTFDICPEGEVGEFWIKGPGVAQGYFREPEATLAAFRAVTSDGSGPYLRTGDLGFVKDRELFFVARLKEMFLLAGVNYWPHDLEETVERAHPLLRKGCGAIFSIDNGTREELTVVMETKKGVPLDLQLEKEIIQSIQKALFAAHSLPIDPSNVHLVMAGTVPKTTSGKVQRLKCKQMVENEELKHSVEKSFNGFLNKFFRLLRVPDFCRHFFLSLTFLFYSIVDSLYSFLISWKTRSLSPQEKKLKELSMRIEAAICAQLNVQSIDWNTPLFEYGLTSVDAVALGSQLETFLGHKVEPNMFLHFPTISQIAQHLSQPLTKVKSPSYKVQPKLPKTETKPLEKREAFILGMGTAFPEHSFSQEEVFEYLLQTSSTLRKSTIVDKVRNMFRSAAVEHRNMVAPLDTLADMDGTGSRNDIYVKEAPSLCLRAAKKALEDWGGDPKEITHVISVTCTGTVIPGLEFLLVESLGISRWAERQSIGFMGCFGALAGMRAATTIAHANPHNRALVVCTELCSLHIQKEELRMDNWVASAIFGDGAAAMIVGGSPSPIERPIFQIESSQCYAISNSTEKIQWILSDSGWKVGLSPDIPAVFQEVIGDFCLEVLGDHKPSETVWAIHPGGKAVVQAIEKKFELVEAQTKSSWEVLREHGNMSSGTVLCILDDLRKNPPPNTDPVLALAFGPGLAMEGTMLRFLPRN